MPKAYAALPRSDSTRCRARSEEPCALFGSHVRPPEVELGASESFRVVAELREAPVAVADELVELRSTNPVPTLQVIVPSATVEAMAGLAARALWQDLQ